MKKDTEKIVKNTFNVAKKKLSHKAKSLKLDILFMNATKIAAKYGKKVLKKVSL